MEINFKSKYESNDEVYALVNGTLRKGVIRNIKYSFTNNNTVEFEYELLLDGKTTCFNEKEIIPSSAVDELTPISTPSEPQQIVTTKTITKTIKPNLKEIITNTITLYGKWMFNSQAQKMEAQDYILQNFGDVNMYEEEPEISENISTETISPAPKIVKGSQETKVVPRAVKAAAPIIEEKPIQKINLEDVFSMPTVEEEPVKTTKGKKSSSGTKSGKKSSTKKADVEGPIYPHQEAPVNHTDEYVMDIEGYPESKSRVEFPEDSHFILLNASLLRK